MKMIALLAVLGGLAACNLGDDPGLEVGHTSRAVIVDDTMIIYYGDAPIDDEARAIIDGGGQLGRFWVRVETPLAPIEATFDVGIEQPVKFAQELGSADPSTGEPTTFRFDFVAGEEGFAGYIERSSSDDVEYGAVSVRYRVTFKGLKAFADDTPRPLDFDSANDSTMVPEDPF